MVRAYHAIFTAYGFWLPNDPRGSWSEFVRTWELFRFGPATKTNARHSLARNPHDRAQRLSAKQALQYPPVHLNGAQALASAQGFAKAAKESGYVIHACSILPEHVHVVVARHRKRIEAIVAHLKSAATKRMNREGLHPMKDVPLPDGDDLPSPWARGLWKVFLNSDADIRRAIRYVEENPLKEGKPHQRWSFVTSLER